MSDKLFEAQISPTFKEIANRFDLASKRLGNDREEQATQLGGLFLKLARKQAPKKTGDFANALEIKTFKRGLLDFGFRLVEPQPLGKWIRLGTKRHPITPKRPGYPLAFYWPKMGRMWFTYAVDHPGTKANPYLARAEKEWRVEANKTNKSIATRYVTTIAKGRAL